MYAKCPFGDHSSLNNTKLKLHLCTRSWALYIQSFFLVFILSFTRKMLICSDIHYFTGLISNSFSFKQFDMCVSSKMSLSTANTQEFYLLLLFCFRSSYSLELKHELDFTLKVYSYLSNILVCNSIQCFRHMISGCCSFPLSRKNVKILIFKWRVLLGKTLTVLPCFLVHVPIAVKTHFEK